MTAKMLVAFLLVVAVVTVWAFTCNKETPPSMQNAPSAPVASLAY